jgi:hypothetical protein
LDEEDARSSVADLITVNESAADDAYSLAYIQVTSRLPKCYHETAGANPMIVSYNASAVNI